MLHHALALQPFPPVLLLRVTVRQRAILSFCPMLPLPGFSETYFTNAACTLGYAPALFFVCLHLFLSQADSADFA